VSAPVGRLLFPALRWEKGRGFDGQRPMMEAALAAGVGGFCIFGGEADAVRALTAELRARAGRPLLFSADLERGAGQQFAGATPLPPAAALAALDSTEVLRRAGQLTAREGLALGVNWIYAPVADVELEPANPIVGTRALGTEPAVVAERVVAWVEGCRATGALACVKHFPGHGRTTTDSHTELPRVAASRAELEADLMPFRAAIAAGVESVMSAHVAYPALDPSGRPATLSRPIATELLRGELGFSGLLVTDALIMEGVRGGGGEGGAVVAAAAAGCDCLLYPEDVEAVLAALRGAGPERLPEARVAEAVRRVEEAAGRAPAGGRGAVGAAADRAWAEEVAERCLQPLRGAPALRPDAQLLVVDDDVGGPFAPPSRADFAAAAAAAGAPLRPVQRAEPGGALVITLYADIRAWKGSPRITHAARARVRAALAVHPDAAVVLFGHPRLAAELAAEQLLVAWGGEAIMQRAAARWLAGRGA